MTMIIYNVTVKVENEIHDAWLQWMRSIHIPEVMATGCFEKNELAKVLVDDTDGQTYSIQYRCRERSLLEQYFEMHAPKLQEEHLTRYKDKFVAFRTLLELID